MSDLFYQKSSSDVFIPSSGCTSKQSAVHSMFMVLYSSSKSGLWLSNCPFSILAHAFSVFKNLNFFLLSQTHCTFYLSKGICNDCNGLHVIAHSCDKITFAFFDFYPEVVKESLDFCYYLCPPLTWQSQQAGNARHLVSRSKALKARSLLFKIKF